MNAPARPEGLMLRSAEPEDIPGMLSVYAPYIEHTAVTFEYTVPTEAEFLSRVTAVQQKYPWLVATLAGKVVGYAYAAPFHTRPACGWAVEVSVYIDRQHRRCGIGRALYQRLEEGLKRQNILNVMACIASTEAEDDPCLSGDSLLFHERLGYRLVGEFQRCGYKFGRWYGLVWMDKYLGEHTASPKAVIPFSGKINP